MPWFALDLAGPNNRWHWLWLTSDSPSKKNNNESRTLFAVAHKEIKKISTKITHKEIKKISTKITGTTRQQGKAL